MNNNPAFTERKISFLATGSEILFGDLQESNCYRFSKTVSQNGGQIYQHVHASDRKNEIVSAIEYLLSYSDALIITGGLGPTSDDNTRFAVAEYVGQDLYFDENAWKNIFQRLKRFHLPLIESNRQQALFPIGSILYPNQNGSAPGFHVKWKNKFIFVLPGPPKECTPLFEEYIMQTLFAENFLHQQSILYWTTLGLVESEAGAKIDELAKSYKVETGYRWHYPYLDIKIISDTSECIEELRQKIENLLKPYLVSHNQNDAFVMLESVINTFPHTICVIDHSTFGEFEKNIQQKKICFVSSKDECPEDKIVFLIESSKDINKQSEYSGVITFECTGWFDKHKKYSHNLSVSYRGKEVSDYAKHYAAWQLNQFILFLINKGDI